MAGREAHRMPVDAHPVTSDLDGDEDYDLTVRSRASTVKTMTGTLVTAWVAYLVINRVAHSNLDFGVMRQYVFSKPILDGAQRTLLLTVIAMALGSVLGFLIALARLSHQPLMRTLAAFYAWIFRGTPVLVQLIIWFNLGLILPRISIGVPGTDVEWSRSTNALITPFVAALLGLALNEAAYLSEIIRAGFISVDRGQAEASTALGMRKWTTVRRIVLPQAMRAIIPPAGNELITCLKTTSLVSIISYKELLGTAEGIYSVNYRTLELLVVASLWYLASTTLFSVLQYFVERRFGRGIDVRSPRSRVLTAVMPRREQRS